jgi:hypothetical protein
MTPMPTASARMAVVVKPVTVPPRHRLVDHDHSGGAVFRRAPRMRQRILRQRVGCGKRAPAPHPHPIVST